MQQQAEANAGSSSTRQAGLEQEQAGSTEGQAAAADKQETALCEKGSKQWAQGIAMAGLPWALQLLAAFARGHQVCLHSQNNAVTHQGCVCARLHQVATQSCLDT